MNKLILLALVFACKYNIAYPSIIKEDIGNSYSHFSVPEYRVINLKEMRVCTTLDSLLRKDIIPFMKNLYLVKDYFIGINFGKDSSISIIIEKKEKLDRYNSIFAFNDDYYYSIYFSGLTVNRCITLKSDKLKKHKFLKPGTYIPDFYDPYVRSYKSFNDKYIQTEGAIWIETKQSDIDPILYYSVTKLSDKIRKYNSLLYFTRPTRLKIIDININK